MTNKEKTLWNRILNGEFPLIEVIDLPVGTYQHIDLKTKQIGSSKNFETESLDFKITLEKLVMDNEAKPTPTKIYIYPPTNELAYWFDNIVTHNPDTFEPIQKLVRYLRVAKLTLTSSQYDFEMHKFELKAKKRVLDKRKEHEYESIFIDNTDYKRNRLMLLLTN